MSCSARGLNHVCTAYAYTEQAITTASVDRLEKDLRRTRIQLSAAQRVLERERLERNHEAAAQEQRHVQALAEQLAQQVCIPLL